LVSKDRS